MFLERVFRAALVLEGVNERKLGRKLCKLGEMRQHPVLLPEKLVFGDDIMIPKQTTITVKDSGYLHVVIRQ